MGTVKKFIVTKEQISGAITYLEYENINGVSFSPKNKKIDSDMINVSKVVVINPSLIEKLIDKKCNKQLERIVKLLTTLYNDTDGDGDTNLGFVLNEIEKFRQLIDSKYNSYYNHIFINKKSGKNKKDRCNNYPYLFSYLDINNIS